MTPLIQGIDPGRKPGFALTDPCDLRERKYGKRLGRVIAVGRKPIAEPQVCAEGELCGPSWRGRSVRNVTELQWSRQLSREEMIRGTARRGAAPEDIMSLAFRAGFTLAALGGGHALPVHEWKGALFRGGGGISKGVFLARLEALLLPDERPLVPCNAKGELDPDCLDAIGISWAASLVQGKEALTLEKIL